MTDADTTAKRIERFRSEEDRPQGFDFVLVEGLGRVRVNQPVKVVVGGFLDLSYADLRCAETVQVLPSAILGWGVQPAWRLDGQPN